MSRRRRTLSALKRTARAIGALPSPVQRSDEPYATHLPVLIAMAALRPIRQVLELGCGEFSTTLFLDRRAFPDLKRLVSVEDDPEWAENVRRRVGSDARLSLQVVEHIPESLPVGLTSKADLILIDNGRTAPERAAVIDVVARQLIPGQLVAIHDYEVPAYSRAARAFGWQVGMFELNPATGLAGASEPAFVGDLKMTRRRLSRNRAVAPTDVEGWARLLRSEQNTNE